ncbi:putative enzyme related to lactoylglutathione lyase [Pararhizobium capsulatum DSM 1112]|uniref:Enzyme related to lactoylglutathione lyase n=1 Tax=Pararhizobium capsulatum DSM 1112 TaxID=1121113 RepID=A0ABU0BUD4_9HYPH|nr:VOC family protein [Pararhizobium capsulatum]MDQ0321854.1 putative enzyme related to lactoylglutathione lyase [Pararhizobium capsulatum DSM 1112]
MQDAHGTFVWYELMTTDTGAAKAFYTEVTGWSAKDSGMPGVDYTLFCAPSGEQVAGLMTMPESASKTNIPPAWLGYIAVHDVDGSAAEVTSNGGTVHRAPDDIPGVGRFAVVSDPHGAVFALFRGLEGDTPPTAPMGTPGFIGWNELMAGDLETDFTFYSALFGWNKGEGMDMGSMGVYQIFGKGEAMFGGMMTKPATVPAPPFWTFYIGVDAIDAAIERLTKAGGKVINGPMEVPGGAWIVQAMDPQGAGFALLAPKR